MIAIIFFIFGAAIGSFLNVLILRFPDFHSIATGRSECPNCKKQLSFFELIPIFSFIFLLGRCKNCKKRISWQYILVELLTALLFLAFYLHFGLSFQLVIYLLIASISVIIFVFDLKYLEIPEIYAWLLLFFSVLALVFSGNFNIANLVYGGLAGGGLIALLVLLSKERLMGAGDIKIGLAYGILLGWERALLFLFLSFVIGAIVGVFLLAFGKKGLKSQVPFAPFLIVAAFTALFFGDKIINYYLNFAIM